VTLAQTTSIPGAALADAGLTTSDVTIVDAQPNEGQSPFSPDGLMRPSRLFGHQDHPRRREGAKVIITVPTSASRRVGRLSASSILGGAQKAFDTDKAAISRVMKAVSHWLTSLAIRQPSHAIDFAATWASKMSGKALKREDVESTMESATFFNAQAQKQIIGSGALVLALKQHAEFLVRHNRLKKVRILTPSS